MSTAVPEQRNAPVLSDEQVIELDRWYPYTPGRAVVYAVWLYFFTLGAVAFAELFLAGGQTGSVFFVALGPAVGGAIGAMLGKNIRRQRIKVRHEKRVLKAKAKGIEVDDQAFPLRPSTLYLVGVSLLTGLAFFGLLHLITHLGIFEATSGFTLVMCFVMAAITTWVMYLPANDRKDQNL